MYIHSIHRFLKIVLRKSTYAGFIFVIVKKLLEIMTQRYGGGRGCRHIQESDMHMQVLFDVLPQNLTHSLNVPDVLVSFGLVQE